MLDGRQLRALLIQFNERYFGGRLPAYAIRVVAKMTAFGEAGRCNKKRRLIEIQCGLSDEEATSTLLHEMAHAATNGHHRMPWKKEMIRLRESGAPLAGCDLNLNLDDWDGARVTRKQFRGAVQDLLIDDPNITLSAALLWFMHTIGGPTSIKEFQRKYPWVKTVFNDEKKQNAKDRKLQADFLLALRKKAPAPKP